MSIQSCFFPFLVAFTFLPLCLYTCHSLSVSVCLSVCLSLSLSLSLCLSVSLSLSNTMGMVTETPTKTKRTSWHTKLTELDHFLTISLSLSVSVSLSFSLPTSHYQYPPPPPNCVQHLPAETHCPTSVQRQCPGASSKYLIAGFGRTGSPVPGARCAWATSMIQEGLARGQCWLMSQRVVELF